MLYTLAEHVSLAPSSITYIAVAVAGAVGAIHGIVKIIDWAAARNGKLKHQVQAHSCGLEPSITKLSDNINKLCAITKEQTTLNTERFQTLGKSLDRIEDEVRSQA